MSLPEGLRNINFPIIYDPNRVPTTPEEAEEQEELRQMFEDPGLGPWREPPAEETTSGVIKPSQPPAQSEGGK